MEDEVSMEDEVRQRLRQNYRPAATGGGAPHLDHFAAKIAPTLRDELNYQLSLVPGRALADDECRHCGAAPPPGLQIRGAVISGSVADRIGWLVINGRKVPLRSDHDFMLELNVARGKLRAEWDAEPCLAPADEPGYFWLLRGRSARCRHDERRPLAAGQVRDVMEAAVRRHRPQVRPHVSGPAVTFHDGHGDVDCVSCVPVRRDAAVPWLAELRDRSRPAGWPADDLLDALDGPLHLGPVGPRAGDDQLWRLSFSRPEALLMRGLPPAARYCLMMLKALRISRKRRLGHVTSYYLKTCVFWVCEERPDADWEDTLGSMRAVLDRLQSAVDSEFLACYFWEELNVLRDPTRARLAALQRDLDYFRDHLTELLHDMLTDNQRFEDEEPPEDDWEEPPEVDWEAALDSMRAVLDGMTNACTIC